jgi:hypothetical protein
MLGGNDCAQPPSCQKCGCRLHRGACREPAADVCAENLSIDAPAPELLPLPTRPVFGARMNGLQAGTMQIEQPNHDDQFAPSTTGDDDHSSTVEHSSPRRKQVTEARFIER